MGKRDRNINFDMTSEYSEDYGRCTFADLDKDILNTRDEIQGENGISCIDKFKNADKSGILDKLVRMEKFDAEKIAGDDNKERFDMLKLALHWEKYFKHILDKYNSIYKVQLPTITPHVCRHTFCSNMAKSGMNPKTLQYIMGHSDIGVTLNTYTHFSLEDAKEEMGKICANA